MIRRILLAGMAAAVIGVMLAGCSTSRPTVKVGLMYPTSGPQGGQGIEEKQGAELAAEWVNAHGGVDGRHLQLLSSNLDRPESVPGAMAALHRAGVSVVVGTHGAPIRRSPPMRPPGATC